MSEQKIYAMRLICWTTGLAKDFYITAEAIKQLHDPLLKAIVQQVTAGRNVT